MAVHPIHMVPMAARQRKEDEDRKMSSRSELTLLQFSSPLLHYFLSSSISRRGFSAKLNS
jgi:hypothetical protein